MNVDVYLIWSQAWKREHPDKQVPSREQVERLMEMFEFTEQDLLGLGDILNENN